nr:FecR domain-containing protein [Sphingobium sp. EM0848]
MSEDSSAEWEAAQWVARQMGNEPFDMEGFNAWLAADSQHKPLFDTMWHRIMGPAMDQALNSYGTQARSRRNRLAAGAVGLLALAGGYGAWPSVELFMAQPQDYAAAGGTIRQISLEDGTRLTLAGGAVVRVRYTRRDRLVELTGGTIFADVVHDENRPFRIDTGDARITDLGTRFEVSSKASSVRVTVESGAVRLGAKSWFGKRIDLFADQAGIMAGAEPRRTTDVSRDSIARWRNEWVEYRDAPLSQVVGDLESVSPLPIRIADRTLANLRVSGRIRLTDPLRQVDNLSFIHHFTVQRGEDAVILSHQ